MEIFKLSSYRDNSQDDYDQWKPLFHAKASKMIFKGEIIGVERYPSGDQQVRCWVIMKDHIKLLIPQHETHVKKASKFNQYIGEEVPFLVYHVDYGQRLVLCSQNRAFEVMRKIGFKRFKVGQCYQAVVEEVLRDQLTVEFFGFRFYLSRNELNVIQKNMRNQYKQGQKVLVQIMEVDRRRKKIEIRLVLEV